MTTFCRHFHGVMQRTCDAGVELYSFADARGALVPLPCIQSQNAAHRCALVSYPTPEEQVNDFKHNQLTKAAKFYLSRYGVPQPPARFDVIAIVWPSGREPQIRHTPDAFEATF